MHKLLVFLNFLTLFAIIDRVNAASNGQVQAETWLRASRMQVIPTAPGTPFQLQARVRIYPLTGAPVDGRYQLLWYSPNEWREELQVGDRRRVAAVLNGVGWEHNELSIELDSLRFPLKLLKEGPPESLPPELTVTIQPSPATDRADVRCAVAGYSPREVVSSHCFDTTQGLLLSVQAGPTCEREVTTVHLLDYTRQGDRLFPRTLIHASAQGSLAELEILDIQPASELSRSLLRPPEDVLTTPYCPATGATRTLAVTSSGHVKYPRQARLDGLGGVVCMSLTVNEKGRVIVYEALSTPDQRLSDAVMESLQEFEYEVPACFGQPVKARFKQVFRFQPTSAEPDWLPGYRP